MAWEHIKENIKILAKSLGLCEWKQNKLWFDEDSYQFLDQRKQANSSGYRIQTKVM